MTFNKYISGNKYTAADSDAVLYVLRADGTFAGTSGQTNFSGENREYVVLTGWQEVSARGNTMSQTVGGKWIYLPDGWQAAGTVQYPASEAQKYIDRIISDNYTILCNNLLCARFDYKLTESERQQLYALQARLNRRNASLVSDGMVSSVKTAMPDGYGAWQYDLKAFMDAWQGVGVVITTGALIVISCMVLAGFATAAYFAYKAWASESAQDVRYSDELTRTLLSKLTAEEYAQLMEETNGLVTKARLRERLGTGSKYILLGIALIAAGWIIHKYRN